ncbi:MAG: Exo-alpha-sialidase, partial [Pedosphaera sp.]|nr:Exo-alpha-sialidase [Pedosphaera sp.]
MFGTKYLIVGLMLPFYIFTALGAAPLLEKIDVFEGGSNGYQQYRIPGIAVTAKGTVLAYCEGRKTGKGDWDTIDLFLRRSTDGGKTWGPFQKIADVPGPKQRSAVALKLKAGKPEDVTYNNPVIIADQKSGIIHLLFCLEYSRCFYLRSIDDGVTLGKPVEITKSLEKFRKDYDWKVVATGPGHGIRLKNGRLVVPAWFSTGEQGHHPSVTTTIFSDDDGVTWQAGEIAIPNTAKWINPSEAEIVELADGRVMMNGRSEAKRNRRLVTFSRDGSSGWTKPQFAEELKEPICMGSIARFSLKTESDKNRIIFSNPDNLARADHKQEPGKNRDRKNLSIKLSYDEGTTWPITKVLEAGISSYSDLAVLKDGTVLCLYERCKAGET